jgi:thiol-disulfide isomerase/thioredoxin
LLGTRDAEALEDTNPLRAGDWSSLIVGATSTKKRGRKSASRKSRRWLIWIGAVAVGVVAVGLLVVSGGGSDLEPTSNIGLEPAPEIALPNFQGETVRLSDFEGQGLVVNYWASWCLPCLVELPGFEEVYQERKGEVAFLGINLADDPTAALSVAADAGITYPLAVDVDGSSYNEFGGFAMPTTVFINSDGYVVEVVSGPLTASELEVKITRNFES